MPELPEVEITIRRLAPVVVGQQVTSAAARGINTLKTYDPPLTAIVGDRVVGLRRRGKLIIIDFEQELSLLVHLMTAGRLQYFHEPSSATAKSIRLAIGLSGGG